MTRFLVVDDDRSTVKGLTRLLTGDGHHVSPFTSGAEAVAALSRESFDAVFTDLEMPHTDGHAVVRAARMHLRQACVVVVSGAPERAHELVEAGACMVADKPFDYDSIIKHVAQCRRPGGPRASGGCQMKATAMGFTPSPRRHEP